MMKTPLRFAFLAIIMACCLSNNSLIAHDDFTERCATNAHTEQLLNENQEYRTHHEQVRNWTDTQTYPDPARSEGGCANTITLPIAIHYQDVANTPDVSCLIDLAYDQVNRLNEDYSGTNFDVANFANYADAFDIGPGNACVEFCLATSNHPNGSGLSNGEPAITFNATNGDFDGNWSGYINIFVQDLGGGLLGYSPLGGQGNGDGVVITHCGFGSLENCSVGPNSSCGNFPFNLGRTLTHELGHYLNLNHIWGDGGCGVDDGIADTPTAGGEYYGCPNLGAASTSCGSQDMFMNYMDYVNDDCMIMFSPGQGQRAYDYASNFLSSLIANAAIVCGPIVQEPPVAIINAPESLEICPANNSINIFSGSTGGSLDYEWTFSGAGVSPASSTIGNPSISLTESGTLTISLTVTNEEGTASTEMNVSVTILDETDAACVVPDCDTVANTYDQLDEIWPANPICGNVYTYTGWEVWQSEGYIVSDIVAGTTYTVDVCTGPNAGSFEMELSAQAPSGAFDGIAIGCELTFTASESGVYTILLNNPADPCGTEDNVDNGYISIQCLENVEECEEDIAVDTVIDCEAGTLTLFVTGGDGNYTINDMFADLGNGVFVADVEPQAVVDVTIMDGSDVCEDLALELIIDCPLCGDPVVTQLQVSTCSNEPIILPDGVTETNTAGTYEFTFVDIAGCDSIVVVDVAIWETSFMEMDAAICNGDSYMLGDGSMVSEAGMYEVTLEDVVGCDSTIVTNLAVWDALSASGMSDCETGLYMITVSGGSGVYSVDGFDMVSDNMFSMAVENQQAISALVVDATCGEMMVVDVVDCATAPEAMDAEFALALGTGNLSFSLADYTSDPNGDVLTFSADQPMEGGMIEVNAETGDVTFMPTEGYEGTLSFAYSVSDGTEMASANITITVELTCESFSPIMAQVLVDINDDNTFSVYVSVDGGGSAEQDGNGYTISAADFSVIVMAGDVYSSDLLSIPSDAGNYIVTITDSFGCEMTYTKSLQTTVDIELLTSLRGVALEAGNNLTWATASEVNNAFFTLESSTDGINFAKINEQEGAGNSSTTKYYEFLDREATNGVSYYRLSQTDFDGSSKVVGLVTVNRKVNSETVISVQPVPTTDIVNVSFVSNEASSVKANLYDVTGKLMMTRNINTAQGNNIIHISLVDYSAGVYFLVINDGNTQQTAKLVRE
ncbi:MAG: T9SS type A sorting domain-containing protein [Chitinophagales bacterium]